MHLVVHNHLGARRPAQQVQDASPPQYQRQAQGRAEKRADLEQRLSGMQSQLTEAERVGNSRLASFTRLGMVRVKQELKRAKDEDHDCAGGHDCDCADCRDHGPRWGRDMRRSLDAEELTPEELTFLRKVARPRSYAVNLSGGESRLYYSLSNRGYVSTVTGGRSMGYQLTEKGQGAIA